VGEGRWEDRGLGDRGTAWIMARLGVLPALVGVRECPAVAFYALSGRLAAFYGEGDEGPFVVVVAAGRPETTVVLGKVPDGDALERALVDHPELDNDEVSWILSDLRAVRVEP
jgi:hypothetical protein